MAKFILKCVNQQGDLFAEFNYDNQTSELTTLDGESVIPVTKKEFKDFPRVSKDTPLKKASPKTLKISLGLSCNYECSYCSQRFVPNADETNPSSVDGFVNSLDNWVKDQPERIEFWGGEPFVYWKTLKPLAEKLKAKYPNANLSTITNGSLLDKEKNEWLDRMDFSVGISHDGPGYHVRGLDPLDDPEKRQHILDLYKILKPKGKISINAMLHKDNKSRAAIEEFLIKVFGEDLYIGEGSFIDPYDEGGFESSLGDLKEHIDFRNDSLAEIRTGKANRFTGTGNKVFDFIKSISNARPASAIGQKCGMDNPENIAVDLRGNVITCQNVSSVSKSFNNESHLIGNTADFENIKLNTVTHWSYREECPKCPVLQICRGSCMFLEGPLWEVSCNNSFSDNISYFSAAIEQMTGFIPFYIEGPHRRDRWDLYGLKKDNIPLPKIKKFIPIYAV